MKVLSFMDVENLKLVKIFIEPCDGAAGLTTDAITDVLATISALTCES